MAARPSCISIHAPVKGATGPINRMVKRFYDFNPRTREGCDAPVFADGRQAFDISIHAPVKGAT